MGAERYYWGKLFRLMRGVYTYLLVPDELNFEPAEEGFEVEVIAVYRSRSR